MAKRHKPVMAPNIRVAFALIRDVIGPELRETIAMNGSDTVTLPDVLRFNRDEGWPLPSDPNTYYSIKDYDLAHIYRGAVEKIEGKRTTSKDIPAY